MSRMGAPAVSRPIRAGASYGLSAPEGTGIGDRGPLRLAGRADEPPVDVHARRRIALDPQPRRGAARAARAARRARCASSAVIPRTNGAQQACSIWMTCAPAGGEREVDELLAARHLDAVEERALRVGADVHGERRRRAGRDSRAAARGPSPRGARGFGAAPGRGRAPPSAPGVSAVAPAAVRGSRPAAVREGARAAPWRSAARGRPASTRGRRAPGGRGASATAVAIGAASATAAPDQAAIRLRARRRRERRASFAGTSRVRRDRSRGRASRTRARARRRPRRAPRRRARSSATVARAGNAALNPGRIAQERDELVRGALESDSREEPVERVADLGGARGPLLRLQREAADDEVGERVGHARDRLRAGPRSPPRARGGGSRSGSAPRTAASRSRASRGWCRARTDRSARPPRAPR